MTPVGALKQRFVKTLFTAGAWGYDFITSQEIWHAHVTHALDECVGSDLPCGDRPERFGVPHRTQGPATTASPADVGSHTASSRPRSVIDLGCGPGVSAFALAESLPDAQVVGIDLSHEMIRRARRHHRRRFAALDNVAFQQADAQELPFADDTFELAFGHSFLYLVPDRDRVLREVHRVLQPGGILLLMEPRRTGNLISASLAARGHLGDALRAPLSASRFALSMVLWRLVSGPMGQLAESTLHESFARAGFQNIASTPTLGGLGMHCHGRVPAHDTTSEIRPEASR